MSRAHRPGNRLHHYNICPAGEDLWRVDWMRRRSFGSCPGCEGSAIPYIGTSPWTGEAASPQPTSCRRCD